MALVRVVLDINVLVSGLAYPASIPGKILAAWHQGRVDVVLSRAILEEMVRVLPRLKRNTLSPAEAGEVAESFLFLASIIESDGELEQNLRNSADQAILGTLRASQGQLPDHRRQRPARVVRALSYRDSRVFLGTARELSSESWTRLSISIRLMCRSVNNGIINQPR